LFLGQSKPHLHLRKLLPHCLVAALVRRAWHILLRSAAHSIFSFAFELPLEQLLQRASLFQLLEIANCLSQISRNEPVADAPPAVSSARRTAQLPSIKCRASSIPALALEISLADPAPPACSGIVVFSNMSLPSTNCTLNFGLRSEREVSVKRAQSG
jgi:hypothetical protein